jgi:hypothetical protein
MKSRHALAALFGAAALIPLVACEPQPDDVSATSEALTVPGKINWLQYGGDSTHRGSNASEWTITPANVAQLKPLYTLPAAMKNGALVIAQSRTVSGFSGFHDVAVVAGTDGALTAFDAITGTQLWASTSWPGTKLSLLSTLAIDPALTYVYVAGTDGFVHKVDMKTGFEVTTAPWPGRFQSLENVSVRQTMTPLTLGTTSGGSYVYAGTGNCDLGQCVGSVTAIALSTGQQLTFNAMCSDKNWHLTSSECTLPTRVGGAPGGGGVWARGGFPFDPATQKLYFSTGDGVFDPAKKFWGNTFISLSANGNGAGSGKPVGSYTPGNFATLDTSDLDLGSANPVILPNNGTSYPHLAMLAGKDRKLRFVNLDALSTTGASGGEVASVDFAPGAVNGNQVISATSTWINPADNQTWIYLSVQNSHRVIAYKLTSTSGKPGLTVGWTQACSAATGSAGKCGGVFVANGVAYYSNGVDLQARDALTGALLTTITGVTSENGTMVPVVVNGILYVGGGLNKAFSIPNGQYQRGRFNNSAAIGSLETFPYAFYGLQAGPPFDPSADQRRFNPEAYTLVLDSTTVNEIGWGMGMASRLSAWTKGSATSLVTTYWNKNFPRREIWEWETLGPGASPRHVTANAPVFPSDQASGAFGVRRQNGKSMIVYRGTDSALHAFYWDPAALVWSYDQLETSFNDDSYIAMSDPMAFKRSTGGVSIVYRQSNCDSCIGEYRVVPSPPAIRGTTALTFSMRPNTIPVGARDNAGKAVIVATTTDGVYFLRDTGSDKVFSYSQQKVFGPSANSIDGSPSFYVRSDGSNAIVFRYEPGFAGVHHLYEAVQQPAGNWTVSNISDQAGGEETEATMADPEAFISADGKDTVIYRTVSQGMYKLERTGPTTWARTKLN